MIASRRLACVLAWLVHAGAARAEMPAAADAAPTVIDLRDEWTPRVFSETAEQPQSYRSTFIALAAERAGEAPEWETARRDRHYELFGIFPAFSVVRARLLDEPRHACHARIDDAALRATRRTLAPWDEALSTNAGRTAALAVARAHLVCDGLLPPSGQAGRFDEAMVAGLALFQRRNMLPSRPVLDRETREAFLTPSRELDFRSLLRALRERVADAGGLVEDGSARNAWEPVLGRFIDSAEYRQALRSQPLDNGAPDLVDRATEAVAVALGWVSPEAAVTALTGGVPDSVEVRLPQPVYHAAEMDLRVEIDRGDVWTSYPRDVEGRPLPSPVRNRPVLTLFAKAAAGEVALVRWPTTIGAWKDETLEGGIVDLRYKPSPVGRRYWRDLVAAPAWFPPPTTPDSELMRRGRDGRWSGDADALGPGYRSAYGLVALLHHRAVVPSAGAETLHDAQIRTHGSGNYRSILRGSSHGCHRLFNHLALRLGSFLLAHRAYERRGLITEPYARTLRWGGRVARLRVESRGYRYELVPPVTVDVLPGRRVRTRAPAAQPLRDAGPSACGSTPPAACAGRRHVDRQDWRASRKPCAEAGSSSVRIPRPPLAPRLHWQASMKITPRTESLVQDLGALAELIDDRLLAGATSSARDEWQALRRRWPSAAQLAAGVVDVSDEELEIMIGKVRRFRTILEAFRRRGLDRRARQLQSDSFAQAA